MKDKYCKDCFYIETIREHVHNTVIGTFCNHGWFWKVNYSDKTKACEYYKRKKHWWEFWK